MNLDILNDLQTLYEYAEKALIILKDGEKELELEPKEVLVNLMKEHTKNLALGIAQLHLGFMVQHRSLLSGSIPISSETDLRILTVNRRFTEMFNSLKGDFELFLTNGDLFIKHNSTKDMIMYWKDKLADYLLGLTTITKSAYVESK